MFWWFWDCDSIRHCRRRWHCRYKFYNYPVQLLVHLLKCWPASSSFQTTCLYIAIDSLAYQTLRSPWLYHDEWNLITLVGMSGFDDIVFMADVINAIICSWNKNLISFCDIIYFTVIHTHTICSIRLRYNNTRITQFALAWFNELIV